MFTLNHIEQFGCIKILARKNCDTMTEDCLPLCSELTQEELNRGAQCNEGRNLDTRFMGDVEEGVCKKCATEHTSKQDLYD